MAQRTVHSIYGTVSALFRDAKLSDKIEQTPCCLDERQLGPLIDKDPEWRASAIFTREEAETIISHPKIPFDRRVVYALELLAGLRTGEAAALRWRHYDPAKQPLGELLVAFAYSTRKGREKGTKTDVVKHVPVYPTTPGEIIGQAQRDALPFKVDSDHRILFVMSVLAPLASQCNPALFPHCR